MSGFTSFARAWLSGAVLLALAGSPLSGQSYGDHEQVLTIGAGAFTPDFQNDRLDADGYLRGTGFDHPTVERAPLFLPEGAELLQICLYSDDQNAFSATQVSLLAVKLVPAGGGGPFELTVPNTTLDTTPGAGFASYCTGALSYTIRSATDLDGDGIPDNTAYFVRASLSPQVRIGGMTVTWKRQVSAPPDVATFSDVPASDGGFQYIEALAASGITAGCGGGNYCPGAPLTRRQMAVHLAKALGLYWPN